MILARILLCMNACNNFLGHQTYLLQLHSGSFVEDFCHFDESLCTLYVSLVSFPGACVKACILFIQLQHVPETSGSQPTILHSKVTSILLFSSMNIK